MKKARMAFFLIVLVVSISFGRPAFAINRFLRIGFNENLPPFQFIDEDGNPTGMHIDMLQAIGQTKKLEFDFMPFENNRMCFHALETGSVDLVLGVIEKTVSTDTVDTYAVSYTDWLTNSQLCMIVPKTWAEDDMALQTGIYASDTIKHTLLANLGIRQYRAVGNQVRVYETQKRYPDSAMIGIKDSLVYLINCDDTEDDYIVHYNYLDTVDFSMAIRQDNQDLYHVINDSIALFKADRQYEDLIEKWLPEIDDIAAISKKMVRLVSLVAGLIVAIVTGYAIIVQRIRQTLKLRVAEQTKEIQQANVELERQFRQLRDEDDLRNRIIKYSPSGMILFDLNYKISLMNNSAYELAGLQETYIGKSVLDAPIFNDILKKEGSAVLRKGMKIDNGRLQLGVGSAKMASYHYLIYQVYRYGHLDSVLLSVRDVTKIDRLQQDAFEKDKNMALTRIAAGIAHEIRNPLMTIRTFATLIGSQGDNKEIQKSFAHYVPEETDRINRLIEGLIQYVKPTQKHMESVQISEMLESCLILIRPILSKSSFTLRQFISSDLFIYADRDQIRQILINILFNGIEAMEQKKAKMKQQKQLELTVCVEQIAGRVAISVRDEGVGMSTEELFHCKDPFYSSKETGTGLGLSLCDQFMKENEGILQIESVQNDYTKITLWFERNN